MENKELGFSAVAAVLIIAAIGLVSAGTYVYFTQSAKQKIETDNTANWQTYRNAEWGIEIKYPLNWNLEGNEMHDPASTAYLGISRLENPKNLSFDEWWENGTNVAGRATVLSSSEDMMIDGVKAKIAYMPEENGWHVHIADNQNHIYSLITEGKVADKQIFEKMLSTFKFINPRISMQVSTSDIANSQTYRNEEFGFEFGGSGFERSAAISQNKCGIAADDKCKVLVEFKSTTSKNETAKIIVSVFSGNIADFIFYDQAGGSTYKFDNLKKQWFFNGNDRATDKNAPKKMNSNLESYIFESGDGACLINAIILPNPNKTDVVLIQELLCNVGNDIIKDINSETILSAFKFIDLQTAVDKTEILASTAKDLEGQAEKVQLADGTTCVFMGGATGVNSKNERMNYQCGDSKNLSMVIYGDLTEGDVWKANISNIERDAAEKIWNVLSVKTVDIAKVWR